MWYCIRVWTDDCQGDRIIRLQKGRGRSIIRGGEGEGGENDWWFCDAHIVTQRDSHRPIHMHSNKSTHTHIHTHTHTHTHAHTNADRYKLVCTRVQALSSSDNSPKYVMVGAHTHTHTHTHTQKHAHTNRHTYIHKRAHAQIILYSLTHTHTHTHIHSYMYIHTHRHFKIQTCSHTSINTHFIS